MKRLHQWLTLGVAVSVLALPTFAQTTQPQAQSAAPAAGQANPCEDQAALDLYNQFRENVKTNQQVSYDAGKQYLEKYSTCEYAKYVKNFVDKYGKATRKADLQKMIADKKFPEAYALGKQILADEPEDLQTLLSISWAGLNVATAPNAPDATLAEAATHAKKTVQLVEAGKSPEKDKPLTNKDETLGWLHFSLGIYTLKSSPTESVKYLHQSLQHEGFVKKDPQTFGLLGDAYQNGMYAPMSKDFQAKFPGGQAETPESKAALDQLYQVADRIIDAYARAVSLATDPRYAAKKAEWTQSLTEFFKFRNKDATTGIDAYIASVATKPLPSPTLPAVAQPATTTTDSTGAAGASTTTPAGTTSAPTSTNAPAGSTTTPHTSSPATTTTPTTSTTPQSGSGAGRTQTTQPSSSTGTTNSTSGQRPSTTTTPRP